jgi:hypothetical protein
MKGYRVFQSWLVVISLFLTVPVSIHSQGSKGQITREDARSLVMAALQSKSYDVKSPKLEVDEETDPNFPSFMRFGVYYNTPERLATIGVFAVNPKTADLWDTGLCKRVITKSVRRLQETLQMRYQLGTAQKGTAPCPE